MERWNRSLSPPPFLMVTRDRSPSASSFNCSGYVITGPGGFVTSASALYTEPAFYSSACPVASESTWAGIGGYYGSPDPLGQDGTAYGLPGIADHQAWYEVVPLEDMVPLDLFGHPPTTLTRRRPGMCRTNPMVSFSTIGLPETRLCFPRRSVPVTTAAIRLRSLQRLHRSGTRVPVLPV
jgi:hypothetical protein